MRSNNPLRQAVSVFAVIAVALCISSACLTAAEPANSNQGFDDRPIVVVREDDIRASWRTPMDTFGGLSALEYAKQKHIPISWGISHLRVGSYLGAD